MDTAKYYVRGPGSPEFLGTFTLGEIKEQLRCGCLTPDWEAIEASGQSHRQLRHATGWTKIDQVIGADVGQKNHDGG